ncbi:MAG: PilZ domain-containing protein [Steroidobacteraceae bacterium]
MFDGADTVVLCDELAYTDIVPARARVLAGAPARSEMLALAERNVRLLQVSSTIDEHGQMEKSEETSKVAGDLLRIETKLNLALDLLGQLLAAYAPRPAAVPVRFNTVAACWSQPDLQTRVGDVAQLDIFLRECLIQPLSLVGTVDSVDSSGEISMQLQGNPEAVNDLIEKIVFRNHRRLVAGSRNTRRNP